MVKRREPETPKEDTFMTKLQAAMEDMLSKPGLEAKDMNALFANAIKFLAVKHKIEGEADGGEFFGE